jgi:hypothetical protein
MQTRAIQLVRWRLALLALACLPALGQSGSMAQAAGSGLYRIAGRVVNAASGEPVRGATVSLLMEADNRRVASAESAEDGHFAMEGLPAAKYQLIASRRGYTTAAYDEHEEFSSAIVTGEGLDTGSLVFRLVPDAVLRGTVTADGGDPVEGATVLLFQRSKRPGPGARIVLADTTTTDDTGAYEFGNLAAGEYLLAVKAEPWYALHREGGSHQPASAASAALDVAYPVTFFDGTTDEASAVPMVLAGGSREEANISLHAVPALHLAVEAPGGPGGSGAWPELRQILFGRQISDESHPPSDPQKRTIEFTGVAPGHYELMQGDSPREVSLDAAASQQVAADAGAPAVAVTGSLQTAAGEELPGVAVVTLEPMDGAPGHRVMETSFSQGSFSFPAVPAGAWGLRVEASGLPAPVVAIAAGGRARPGNRVTVRDRPLKLVVTVSAGGPRVEGFARKDGKGLAGAMVVLVPRDAAAFPGLAFAELVRRDQSDSDGSFSLRNALPGQYTVVAIEDGWALDWSRPEVMGRYLPGGIAVTVAATQGKAVPLSGPVPVQKR